MHSHLFEDLFVQNQQDQILYLDTTENPAPKFNAVLFSSEVVIPIFRNETYDVVSLTWKTKLILMT
jgi:hypothetical protein